MEEPILPEPETRKFWSEWAAGLLHPLPTSRVASSFGTGGGRLLHEVVVAVVAVVCVCLPLPSLCRHVSFR